MFWESLEVRNEIGDKGGMAWCLEKFAEIAILSENVELAIVVFGAASQLRASMGSIIDPADQQDYNQRITFLMSSAGEVHFNRLWREGQAGKLDQIIETIRNQLINDEDG
jgi:hypothetical protein